MNNEREEAWSKLKAEIALKYGNYHFNSQDNNGHTVLHYAVERSDHTMVRMLLKIGADVFVTDDNHSHLYKTVSNNDLPTTTAILESVPQRQLRKLVDMRTKNTNKLAALHIAAKNGYYEQALCLLQFGANFEIENNYGRKPIGLTYTADLRELFLLIDQCFAYAKKGDFELCYDLQDRNPQMFASVANCRNKEGRTIMQVLLMNNHDNLAENFTRLRTSKTVKIDGVYSLVHPPSERIKLFQKFWSEHCSASFKNLRNLFGDDAMMSESNITDMINIWAQALEKVHNVLMVLDQPNPVITNGPLKTIEDVLEFLGFDPCQLCNITAEKACYYEKLLRWKGKINSLAHLMEEIIHPSIKSLACGINAMRLFYAVKVNNLEVVQSILDENNIRTGCVDPREDKSILGYAAEIGNKKIIRLILKFNIVQMIRKDAISPIYLAAREGHAKGVKILLKSLKTEDIADAIDSRWIVESTALHAAAEKGHLDIVKILLRFGATYLIRDQNGRTPLNLSSKQDISDFLKLIDEYFHDAKKANVQLVYKLKALETDEFLAIAGCKNREGLTIATVAAKAGARNIASVILKMLKEVKPNVE